MTKKKPACLSAKNTAANLAGVCGRLSGVCFLTLTFDWGVVLEEKNR
jgi:hypothetical protein